LAPLVKIVDWRLCSRALSSVLADVLRAQVKKIGATGESEADQSGKWQDECD
jgi:hypothetical protein